MHARKALREAAGLGVDDEIDVTLAVEQDVFRAMPGDRGKAHLLEQPSERRRVGRGVLDKFETVGAERIFPER